MCDLFPSLQRERNAFVERLQHVAQEKRLRISFLSGDVHCAAVGLFKTYVKGKEIEVDTSDEAFDAVGSTTMAKPYRVRWRVRSDQVKETILREAAEARRDGYVLRGVRVSEEGVEV